MTQKRKIIVHIATSADGYSARPDGRLDWLTSRPAPKGFYGMPEFTRSVDAKLLGRKTFDLSVEMGAPFSAHDRHYVFSRQPPAASVPAGVEFVSQSIGAFAERLRDQPGKNIWMMGGGELIASFLDEDAKQNETSTTPLAWPILPTRLLSASLGFGKGNRDLINAPFRDNPTMVIRLDPKRG